MVNFGLFLILDIIAKKKSSGSDSDTDSSDSDSDENSESLSSSSRSKSSFLDKKANDDSDSDSDSDSDEESDIEMVRSATRRPHPNTAANKNGHKTMQDKVLEEVQKKLVGTPSSSDQPDLQANEALMAMCKHACEMQDELLEKIDKLGDRLPSNTLDQLIEELGGPNVVAVSDRKFNRN